MGTAKAKTPRGRTRKDATLLMRLDRASKETVQQAAKVQGLSVSDYVRSRVLPLAKQEMEEARTGVLRLPKREQLAFWQALQSPPAPHPAQRALGKLIRSVL